MKTIRIKILFFSLLFSTAISSIIFSSERPPEKLFHAIDTHDQSTIELLLAKEIDVNWQHPDYGTLLIYATTKGNNEAARLLIRKKANIDHQCYPEGPTPLAIAASDNRPEIIQLLLEGKAEPNKMIQNNRTALMFTAGCDNLKIVKQLLANKANAHGQDADNFTALTFAQENNHPEIVQLLTGEED